MKYTPKINPVDLLISVDTTGSMSPAIAQVRREVESTVKYLFDSIPDLRVGLISHGDYCDGPRCISKLDFTDDQKELIKFIRTVPNTSGGDSDECYELVFNEARKLSWSSGLEKAFVFIADANPHNVGYRYGSIINKIDWRNEIGLLTEAGVRVYPVQALGHYGNDSFYNEVARLAKTVKLDLDQFSDVTDILLAIAMHNANKLSQHEEKISKSKLKINWNVQSTIDKLAGRKITSKKKSAYGLKPVHPSRFQVLDVDEDVKISDFVRDNGLTFKTGRGFYEFTKPVTVQSYKEVIIKDEATGDMFSGDEARKILGIPIGKNAKVRPNPTSYTGFIQSTSNNRKLLSGTRFLYEVD